MIEIKIKLNNLNSIIPTKATVGSAGYDIFSSEDKVLMPGKFDSISTGISIELPEGYEAQVRPRSGLAFKHGVTVLNSPGTIDSDFRGEIKVLLINHSEKEFYIERGMRIAQLIVSSLVSLSFVTIDSLSDSNRGIGGFGSTGYK